MVHVAPLAGAVVGHVAPPLLLLPLLLAVVVVPPAPELELLAVLAVDPPAPELELAVPDAPAPLLDVLVEPAGPVLALPPDPEDVLVMFWLTVPPHACTMATNVIPKEAMAALLFMILS